MRRVTKKSKLRFRSPAITDRPKLCMFLKKQAGINAAKCEILN